MKKKVLILCLAALIWTLSACTAQNAASDPASSEIETPPAESSAQSLSADSSDAENVAAFVPIVTSLPAVSKETIWNPEGFFSERELTQNVDLTLAQELTVRDGENGLILKGGVYRLSGSAQGAQITVDAGEEEEVFLYLEGLRLTNDQAPCIEIRSAKEVYLITAEQSDNSLVFSAEDSAQGAAVSAAAKLCLSGLGSLSVQSNQDGIYSSESVLITGGSDSFDVGTCAIRSDTEILIAAGTLNITSGQDGLAVDDGIRFYTGVIFICGGDINVTAQNIGFYSKQTFYTISGTIAVRAETGIDAAAFWDFGAVLSINASQYGIYAAARSDEDVFPEIWVEGGELTVLMDPEESVALYSKAGGVSFHEGVIELISSNPIRYQAHLDLFAVGNKNISFCVNGKKYFDVNRLEYDYKGMQGD